MSMKNRLSAMYLCTHFTMTDGLFLSPEFVLLMCVTCLLLYGFTGCRVSSTFKGVTKSNTGSL